MNGDNGFDTRMRYYQLRERGTPRLAVKAAGSLYDLTAAKSQLQTFEDLLRTSAITDRPIDELADQLLDAASVLTDIDDESLSMPISSGEIWAAGVTYRISEEARKAESSMPDMYLDVYESDRPEVFFKATPDRTVGPNGRVGIRTDSTWDVPEPELGVVLSHDEIVGYTVGNDMSSRSIEGRNPLYLPQAKVYDRCCAIGPCVRSAESVDDPHDLEMWMEIRRDEDVLYDESTNTNQMVRSVEELVDCYLDHNAVPEVSVLLTGTSLVPDDDFTLREGDVVEIGLEGIGTLSNTVIDV